jgi:2-haloacid dehalogenase
MPRAFVFDLYGTLLDVRSLAGTVARALAGRPVAPAAFLDLWRQTQLEYSWQRALMGRYVDFLAVTGDALEFTAARFGTALDDVTRASLMRGWERLEPYPEVAAVLDRLAPRPRVVLSNGSPSMLAASLAGSGLESRIDRVLSVDAARTYKPSPAVYRVACDALGLAPGAVTFVSSNAWDAAGAKAFGLRVVWVNRAGAPFARLGVAPDAEARDLAPLAAGAG